MTVVNVDSVLGRQAGFRRDITSVAGGLQQMRREPTSVIPAVFVPPSSTSSTFARSKWPAMRAA